MQIIKTSYLPNSFSDIHHTTFTTQQKMNILDRNYIKNAHGMPLGKS